MDSLQTAETKGVIPPPRYHSILCSGPGEVSQWRPFLSQHFAFSQLVIYCYLAAQKPRYLQGLQEAPKLQVWFFPIVQLVLFDGLPVIGILGTRVKKMHSGCCCELIFFTPHQSKWCLSVPGQRGDVFSIHRENTTITQSALRSQGWRLVGNSLRSLAFRGKGDCRLGRKDSLRSHGAREQKFSLWAIQILLYFKSFGHIRVLSTLFTLRQNYFLGKRGNPIDFVVLWMIPCLVSQTVYRYLTN